MDRGAWRATVQRVAQSWTRLKQLSTHIHIYPFFFRCLSHLGHHRTLSRVLCVIQWVPASYLFYTCVCSVWRRQWHPTPVLLPGKSHGWRSLVGCSPWGRWESDTTERLHFHFSLPRIGEGNGNPLHCSCLENPRDRGAWWAAVSGVAQSRTRLK